MLATKTNKPLNDRHKQKGESAYDAHNVFHHLFYEGEVDIYTITDPLKRNATIGFINNFGQVIIFWSIKSIKLHASEKFIDYYDYTTHFYQKLINSPCFLTSQWISGHNVDIFLNCNCRKNPLLLWCFISRTVTYWPLILLSLACDGSGWVVGYGYILLTDLNPIWVIYFKSLKKL